MNANKNNLRKTVFLALTLTTLESAAAEIGTTVYTSSGDYGGTSETDFSHTSLFYKAKHERWSFKLDIPYISIEGPGRIVDDGIAIDSDDQTGDVRRSGLGDILFKASYLAHISSDRNTFVGYSLKLKIPTADENDGLGSGAADYVPATDVYHRIDRTTLFTKIGYKFRGNSSNIKLQNGVDATIGVDHAFGNGHSIGYMYHRLGASTAESDDIQSSIVYGKLSLTAKVSLLTFFLTGHSNRSADTGLGSTLTIQF